MNRNDESPEKRLQRNRDETRRLENTRFIASIVFALLGLAAVATILFWVHLNAGRAIIDQVMP